LASASSIIANTNPIFNACTRILPIWSTLPGQGTIYWAIACGVLPILTECYFSFHVIRFFMVCIYFLLCLNNNLIRRAKVFYPW
jgi:hypothetical protein